MIIQGTETLSSFIHIVSEKLTDSGNDFDCGLFSCCYIMYWRGLLMNVFQENQSALKNWNV